MLYELNKEVYILANGKYYKLKVDEKGNIVPIKDKAAMKYELPRYNLITMERARELLGAKEEKPKGGVIA